MFIYQCLPYCTSEHIFLITAYRFALLIQILLFQLTFLSSRSKMRKEHQYQILFPVTVFEMQLCVIKFSLCPRQSLKSFD